MDSLPTSDHLATACSLYVYYDQCQTLLYVGITERGDTRLQEHALNSAWWPFVDSSRVTHFASRAEARAVEKELIKKEKPPFNRSDNPDAWSGMVRYFMERMPNVAWDHRHDNDEAYTRCSNCRRCAEIDETAEIPLCEGCQGIDWWARASGAHDGEQRVLRLALEHGLDLTAALDAAKNRCPF